MELTKAVIIIVGFLTAVCLGLPANRDDVEVVPAVRTYGDKPIVDTGVFSEFDNPFSGNPFGGLFTNLEGLMERMRQHIASLFSRLPSRGGNSTEDFPTFSDVLEHSPIGFPNIDLSKGNSTSITKVIDGRTVVINETEYKKEDDFGGTFFKVRVIDVKPDSSELTTEANAETVPEQPISKDKEEVADSRENEISKSKEVEVFMDISPQYNIAKKSNNVKQLRPVHVDAEWIGENFEEESLRSLKPAFDSNGIEEDDEEFPAKLPIDLSRDGYVNEILAKRGRAHNPDAEVFMVDNV